MDGIRGRIKPKMLSCRCSSLQMEEFLNKWDVGQMNFTLPAAATLLVNMAKYSPFSDSINILTLSFSSFVNVGCKMNLGHVALSLGVRAEKDVN